MEKPTPTVISVKLGGRCADIPGMKDPVFQKLKDDARLVLNELILAITHRPAQGEWRYARDTPPAPEMALLKPVSPPQHGLCYFHLN